MKAAVLKEYGETPVYESVDQPFANETEEIVVKPIASAIKQIDIAKAAGTHYTKFDSLPAVMGLDGVAMTNEGNRVYALGVTGMMAERAIVKKRGIIPVPESLDSAIAAAIPNTLVGSDLALLVRGEFKPGDVVFINGATGATGMMAVQMAKIRGAKKIIVTGRNDEKLIELKKLGADVTIDLKINEHEIKQLIKKECEDEPYTIVIDYLWGRPAELFMDAIGQVENTLKMKYISIGNLDNKKAAIPSQVLRSNNIQIIGSGIGSFPQKTLGEYLIEHLPKVYQLAIDKKLSINTNNFDLSDISSAWRQPSAVILMNQND